LDEESRILARDSEIKLVRLHAAPRLDERGTTLAIDAVAEDITNRKLLKVAVDEERVKLRACFEHLPVLAYHVSLDGTIVDLNELVIAVATACPWARSGQRSLRTDDG
jgi:PAS domain-containing protein